MRLSLRTKLRPTLLADGSALAALLLLLASPLTMSPAAAEPEVHRSHVIKVQTGDAEVIEADVSHLLPGESELFVTDSGTTVDLLRTEHGMEVWIDGELVDDSGAVEAQLAHAHRLEEILDAHLGLIEDLDIDRDVDIEIDCQAGDADTDEPDCLRRVMIAQHVDSIATDLSSAEQDALRDSKRGVRVIRIEKHAERHEEIVD